MPSQRGAAIQALLFQLDQTQWWPADRLAARQFVQLQALLDHAYETVPYYGARLAQAGFRPGGALTAERWRQLPVLERRELQSAGDALRSLKLPPQYEPTREVRTSGSTGEPVEVLGTQVDGLMWDALTLRDHLWHRRDFSARLAVIRANLPGHAVQARIEWQPDWGAPVNLVYDTGPAALIEIGTDIATQAAWLMRNGPEYLLTYPNNVRALIDHLSARGERPPRLREVRTFGETVTPELRAACRDAWGVNIAATYSSQEVGYLALQCPESGLYHVMSESVLLEVLRPDGGPCAPGETGRVVVTRLHSFAMPLIRYDLRDFAEAGEPCPCGRGLPTIARVVGRSRNLVRLPDGTSHWPAVGYHAYRDIAPIRQYQLVQRSLEEIEVRLVADRELTPDEEARLAAVIRSALGHPFRIAFAYFKGEIPRGAGGKFEEFVSEVR